MKYLPVLQELFESDTIIFLMIGMVIAVIFGLRLKETKKCIKGSIASIVLYAACELMSNIRTNFMLEIILVFVGTFAMGGCIGFIIALCVKLFKAEKENKGV